MRHRSKWVLFILLAILPKAALALPLADWSSTEGAAGGGRYSPLAEINRDNVSQLQIAWTYRHGDVKKGGFLPDRFLRGTAFEGTPIVVGGRLIFTTPFNRVIALDPTTGEEIWSYDPKIDTGEFYANLIINRGVGYWRGSCSRHWIEDSSPSMQQPVGRAKGLEAAVSSTSKRVSSRSSIRGSSTSPLHR